MARTATHSDITNINSLPDELMLKVIKFAASGGERYDCPSWLRGSFLGYNHNFILSVISKITRKFQRISKDASLWRGNVIINVPRADARLALRECINKGTTFLKIRISSGGNISSNDLMDIYKRCTNLEDLDILIDLDSWPMFPSIAWKSMLYLDLHLTKDIDPIKFWGKDMDAYLPNLLGHTICTPKLHYTSHLQEVTAYLKPEVKLPERLHKILQYKGTDITMTSIKCGTRMSHQCKNRLEMLNDGKMLEIGSATDSRRKVANIAYELSRYRVLEDFKNKLIYKSRRS